MTVYVVQLALVCAGAWVAWEARDRLTVGGAHALTFLALTSVPAARSLFVGTDSGYYVRYFDATRTFEAVRNSGAEPGYFFLCWIGHYLFDNFASAFFLVAAIVAGGYLVAFRSLSVNPLVSWFVLFTSGAYFVSFNGVRQGVAVALVFAAMPALLRGRLLPYLALTGLAMLFHTSAFWALPAYALVRQKTTARFLLLLGAAAVVALSQFRELVSMGGLVAERYVLYGEAVEGGRGLRVLAVLCTVFGFLAFARLLVRRYEATYVFLLRLFSVGVAVSVIAAIQGTGASGIRRLALYFLPVETLLWPIVFANIEPRNRGLFLLLFVLVYGTYWYLTLGAFGNLVPYELNPVFEGWF